MAAGRDRPDSGLRAADWSRDTSAGLLAGLALAAALAVAGPGWPVRAAPVGLLVSPGLIDFMDEKAGWQRGSKPIAVGPLLYAPLAGPRLTHPLRLIGELDCGPVVRAAWLILNRGAELSDAEQRCMGIEPIFEAPGSQVFGGAQ